MKKNLRRKLVLSAVTLGVAAASVTATTFAWFTSNSTASVNEVTGNVADDQSIYVKQSTEDDFGRTVTIDASGVNFTPVQYLKAADSELYFKNGKANTSSDGDNSEGKATAGTHYLQFELDFSTPSNATGTIQLQNVTLTTTATPAFTLKSDAGEATSVKKGQSVTVDVQDSLAMTVTSGDARNTYRAKADTSTYYDAVTYFNNFYGYTKQDNPTDFAEVPATYYTANTGILGLNTTKTLAAVKKATSTTYIDVATIADNTATAKFTLFLDGWDKDCFDAICKQEFKITLDFGIKTA